MFALFWAGFGDHLTGRAAEQKKVVLYHQQCAEIMLRLETVYAASGSMPHEIEKIADIPQVSATSLWPTEVLKPILFFALRRQKDC